MFILFSAKGLSVNIVSVKVRLAWLGTHGASKCWWTSGIVSLITCGLRGATADVWTNCVLNTTAGLFADLVTEATFCLAGHTVSYLDLFRFFGRGICTCGRAENEGNVMEMFVSSILRVLLLVVMWAIAYCLSLSSLHHT